MKTLTCSFFGHRNIESNKTLKQKIKLLLEDLIVNHNVEKFLFGSKSNFNSLCHTIVTELKETYPNIKRINYTCKSENCILEQDKAKYEKIYSQYINEPIKILGFEEEVEHKTKYSAGKASYIERNQAMIIDSDFCVFYYNENYIPITKTNSGTKIAYIYAKQKNKIIINLYSK